MCAVPRPKSASLESTELSGTLVQSFLFVVLVFLLLYPMYCHSRDLYKKKQVSSHVPPLPIVKENLPVLDKPIVYIPEILQAYSETKRHMLRRPVLQWLILNSDPDGTQLLRTLWQPHMQVVKLLCFSLSLSLSLSFLSLCVFVHFSDKKGKKFSERSQFWAHRTVWISTPEGRKRMKGKERKSAYRVNFNVCAVVGFSEEIGEEYQQATKGSRDGNDRQQQQQQSTWSNTKIRSWNFVFCHYLQPLCSYRCGGLILVKNNFHGRLCSLCLHWAFLTSVSYFRTSLQSSWREEYTLPQEDLYLGENDTLTMWCTALLHAQVGTSDWKPTSTPTDAWHTDLSLKSLESFQILVEGKLSTALWRFVCFPSSLQAMHSTIPQCHALQHWISLCDILYCSVAKDFQETFVQICVLCI